MTAYAFGTHYRCRCGHTYGVALGEHGCIKCEARRPAKLVTPKPMARNKPLLPGTKRMKQRHRAIGKATTAEQAYQDAQRAAGCAMCRLLGLPKNACGAMQVHHRTTGDLHGQKQLGQDQTVGLAEWHHQGTLKPEYPTEDAMKAKYGPSLHHHKREFMDLIAEKLGERSTAALQRWADQFLPADAVKAVQ